MIWLKLSCNLMIQVSISSPFVMGLIQANFSPKTTPKKYPFLSSIISERWNQNDVNQISRKEMAEMTKAMQWLNRPCIQHDYAVCAYTMSFASMKQGMFARSGAWHNVMPPISCSVQGRSMPIFTGGPPHSG